MYKASDLKAGFIIGRLKLLQTVRGTPTRWRCQCSCGKRLTIRQSYFTRINPKDKCGSCEDLIPFKTKYKQEHGIWTMMHTRTENPTHVAFHHYGGRGIKVCERWHKTNPQGFDNFVADVGARPSKNHSIDRIDNDKGYEPSNVKWSTAKEQRANQRPYQYKSKSGQPGSSTTNSG